jgi:alpha-glucuronidase
LFLARRTLVRGVAALGCGLATLAGARPARAETGYDLWLRYAPVESAERRAAYLSAVKSIVVPTRMPTGAVIRAELQRGLSHMLGASVTARESVEDGAVVVGTPATSPLVAGLRWDKALAAAGDEGYVIRSATVDGHAAIVIASRREVGSLYGAFHLLRLIQTGQPIAALDLTERPRIQRRVLDHWDNLDGSIERGYAGRSLWKWDELPGRVDPRVHDYARANASIGINGSVINSVNANPRSLTAAYIEKAAALANTMRPYGIRTYLSANFAAPKMIGGLPTADPLDPAVAKWWRDKADEIYRRSRTSAASSSRPTARASPAPTTTTARTRTARTSSPTPCALTAGIVMYRAFVYDAEVDPDRVKRAYKEFVPLDGRFRDNVFVQVKNGPLDFQPREPFHPLFGAIPGTPIMAELQVTQEYLGQSTHLVYLAPMWKEFLDADTFAKGPGSTVAKVVDGTLEGHTRSGMAGVANTGSDTNWTGHDFAQANWYAYGRLAWNPSLTAEAIADEWIRMTWSQAPDVVAAIRDIMLRSREAFVDYTMPLGLHHLIGGDHYAPMPENADARRADWTATYYHRADASGIGFDRTATGSNGVAQYRSPRREQWADPAATPENLLLWFHHLPWDRPMRSGRTLWDELVAHYAHGAEEARGFEEGWTGLRGKVDAERHQAVLAKLHQQTVEAAQWRDKIVGYFRSQRDAPVPAATVPAPSPPAP